ncbi:hypothetical protein AaE_001474 [Aphanomyces astaci]|uniref:Uncharacterized protein n=1 Tax=Aphanomyces astaci TaxID=112090 RepID=A0A6A5ACE0_APHAT|nr:hypothetical protein AaE_001474 [Aphanomyces astaci]
MNHVLTLQDLQGEVSGLGPTEVQRGKDLLTSLSEIEAMIAPIRQVFLKFRDLDAGIKKVKAAIVTAVTSMLRHLLAMTGDKLPIRSDLLHQLRDVAPIQRCSSIRGGYKLSCKTSFTRIAPHLRFHLTYPRACELSGYNNPNAEYLSEMASTYHKHLVQLPFDVR